jgi:hypothetical protein
VLSIPPPWGPPFTKNEQPATPYANRQAHRRTFNPTRAITERPPPSRPLAQGLDDANLWNRATLGFVAISGSTDYLTGQMQELDDALHRLTNTLGAEILDSFVELLD